MMHAVAFSQSQDEGGALNFVAAVPDQSVRTNGNDVVVPDVVNKLFGGVALTGTTGVRARLTSPSLRRWAPWELQPQRQALIPGVTSSFMLQESSPFPLEYNEALNAQIQADPAAAEQQSVIALLCDGPIAPVSGKIFKCRFTATGALVAGVWNNLTIVFPDLLPAGRYSLVGAVLACATAAWCRWYPVGGPWRPGFAPANTVGSSSDFKFRNGMLGKWFDFDQVQPPTIDILGSAAAASATYEGVMDLIPI